MIDSLFFIFHFLHINYYLINIVENCFKTFSLVFFFDLCVSEILRILSLYSAILVIGISFYTLGFFLLLD